MTKRRIAVLRAGTVKRTIREERAARTKPHAMRSNGPGKRETNGRRPPVRQPPASLPSPATSNKNPQEIFRDRRTRRPGNVLRNRSPANKRPVPRSCSLPTKRRRNRRPRFHSKPRTDRSSGNGGDEEPPRPATMTIPPRRPMPLLWNNCVSTFFFLIGTILAQIFRNTKSKENGATRSPKRVSVRNGGNPSDTSSAFPHFTPPGRQRLKAKSHADLFRSVPAPATFSASCNNRKKRARRKRTYREYLFILHKEIRSAGGGRTLKIQP